MGKTSIEWTSFNGEKGYTWNPVTGCSKVSAGCMHYYAENVDRRFAKRWGHAFKPWTLANAEHNVRLHAERIDAPLHWRKPRMVFVNSMSDLFHEKVPFEFLDEVFAVMLACAVLDNRPHTFQVLTKRPDRMMKYLTRRTPVQLLQAWAKAGDGLIDLEDPDVLFSEVVEGMTVHDWDDNGTNSTKSSYHPWGYLNQLWPLPNVWLGVSVENQRAADERIPLLLETPAAVRFLSCEPLLGPMKLDGIYTADGETMDGFSGIPYDFQRAEWTPENRIGGPIDWVIVGGESGPKARPVHPSWVRSLRDQCSSAGVPFFFKQWGEWAPFVDDCKYTYGDVETERNAQTYVNLDGSTGAAWIYDDDGTYQNWTGTLTPMSCIVSRLGKKVAGRELDGRTWDEYPRLKTC